MGTEECVSVFLVDTEEPALRKSCIRRTSLCAGNVKHGVDVEEGGAEGCESKEGGEEIDIEGEEIDIEGEEIDIEGSRKVELELVW